MAGTSATTTTVETRDATFPDRLQLHGSDHPGMVLVSAPLTGNNFLNWSFGIKRALRAKMKLGFIDGTSIKPDTNDPHFEQWIRVDSMVTTWILNSISKDIVEAFMYAKSSRTLWLDLEQRYDVANSAAFTQLMQFLMGLSDVFDTVKHQLLVMDPVPSINRAYSMVQSVEKQKKVHLEIADTTENTALHVKGGQRFDKKRYNVDKRTQYCTHCERAGHNKDSCFKLHGTPDWYKELVDKKKRDAGGARGFTVDATTKNLQSDTKEELLHELIRLVKNTMQPDVQGNLAHVDDFAVPKICSSLSVEALFHSSHCIFQDRKTKKMTSVELRGHSYSNTNPRLPTSNLNWKSPFEILYNRVPDFTQLKVFGCLCYATNTLPHKQKFDKRASKCVFLGYCQSKKAYKIYDLDTHTLFTSRDVIFREDSFPFQSSPPSKSVSLPLPIPDTETPNSLAPHSDPCSSSPNSSIESQPPVPSPPDSRVCLRRSQRVSSKPSWLSDYDCHCISSATSCSPVSYSTAHIQFVAHLSTLQEPKSYLQASKDRNWVEAMTQELNALAANKTWTLTSLPPGKRTIGSRWVYKLKLKPDGSIDPSKSWPLLQLDVNNAFLHGSLDEDVYMVPPDGLLGVESGQVCKLQKSLYGLKQASRQWNLELTTKLLDFGFKQSTHEHCLFIKQSATEFTALLVYVDDILLTGSSEAALHSVRDYLDRLFTIKDLGSAKYFLGLELARSSHGLHVTQRKYLHDILADASMLDAKPAPTPFPSGLKLVLADGSLLPDPNRYRRLVGRLLYLGFTRPDISFAVQQLSQFLQAPRSSHWDAAIHVLRYLKGTPSTSLFFSSSSSVQLSAFSDASLGLLPRLSPFNHWLLCVSWVLSHFLENQETSHRF
ncbi:UNVERIFIED_CONTAM: Retrovirus-related Pol polyprotein from transposon RE1 [Sesamum radiatum]|uniref:Retrovirus-related Pol polyprotein from transposon RE1 n=1 Tax=Sesamum radiatum TaxID=300843 RepID=A0AAW2KAS7_SESRA